MMQDSMGVEILPDDLVVITAYTYGARKVDCGVTSRVVRFNTTRVVVIDADREERAVGSRCLTVLRRDGLVGFEGNCLHL